jgi:hypothetical protein
MAENIAIIPAHKIDHSKWNACVRNADNGLIYASADYLDQLADNWTGLVINDYETIMPIPWRRKYGIRYAYDVPFVQQLGIFTKSKKAPVANMIAAMFTFCKYGDYHFNFENVVAHSTSRTNYVLPLNQGIADNFSEGTRQNIKRSEKFELRYLHGSIEEAVDIYQSSYGTAITHVPGNTFGNFKSACKQLQQQVIIRKMVDGHQNTMAIALLLRDNRRLYNIMNTTVPQGRATEANYSLLSNIFLEFKDSGLLFDFEGSDIDGIGHFYKKFGAINQPYPAFHFNCLPWPLNLIKK